jgi:hypothetical protein
VNPTRDREVRRKDARFAFGTAGDAETAKMIGVFATPIESAEMLTTCPCVSAC